jgi:transposase-like protein
MNVTPESKARLARIAALAAEGKTTNQIAAALAMSYSAVFMTAKRAGITLKTKRKGAEFSIRAVRELFESGTSVTAVAGRFNVSNAVLRDFCAKHGIATPDTKRMCGFGRPTDPASQPETAGAPDAPVGVSPQLTPPPADTREIGRSDSGGGLSGGTGATAHELVAAWRAREACDRFGRMTIDGQPIRFPSYVPSVPWNEGLAIRNSAIFKQRAAAARVSGGVSNVYELRTV